MVTIRTSNHQPTTTHTNQRRNQNPQYSSRPQRLPRRSTPYYDQPTPITITCPSEPRCPPPTTQPAITPATTQRNQPPTHTSGATRTNDSNENTRSKRPRLDDRVDTYMDNNTLPEAALPFYGDFRGTWWNAQALFASDATLQTNKHRHAWSLLAKVDFTGFAETHSTIGHTTAASLPDSAKFFWSHGPTRWQAGVGLAVKHTFLRNFNTTDDSSWQEIAPGRAAKLSLRGSSGALDIYVCYLPTGSQTENEKLHIINKLRDCLAPNDTVLSILMGDWNFVMETEDRLCLRTMEFTGRADKPLARNFQAVLDNYQLHELEQPAYTHENTTAHSKIDRIYINHHVADQLDREFSAATLPRTKLSTHKPITFARKSRPPQANDQAAAQFPSYILHHNQWKRNLHLNYHDRLFNDADAHNPLRRLELLKQSMWDVASTLQHDTPPQANTTDDKLSWTMIFIRAAETINIRRMERAAAAYPFITTLIQAGDPNARIHPNFQALRDHAKDLAHQQLTDELLQTQRYDDLQDQGAQHRKKQQLITRLTRLIPGTTNNIGAILTDNDDLATTPTAIAEALKKHWEPIFRHKPTDSQILHDWLSNTTNFHDPTTSTQVQRTDRQPRPRLTSPTTSRSTSPASSDSSSGSRPRASTQSNDLRANASQENIPQNHYSRGRNAPRTNHTRPNFPNSAEDWRIRRKDINKAIKMSGHSAPGPDGIPYLAWKHSGELASQVLQDAAAALQSNEATTYLQRMHGDDIRPDGHNFNLGLLICLGKKPHSEHPEHGQVYRPESTRPLSIVNTDNRLLANAARLRWEPLLNPWVSPQQQGFLRQRSILKNVLDIDFASMTTALTNNKGALVLFDFASAFPSMSQEYMFELLTSLGVPPNALNMIRALYHNNKCTIQTNGVQIDGFNMSTGVRQGCPLSPLLYAICAEILIERIRMEIPSAIVRAYADDTAVLLQDLWRDTPILAKIFADFGSMSNLHLNLNKTVIIPLFPQPALATVKKTLTRLIPNWSAVQFAYSARYLGFILGPGADDQSWKDPTNKFLQRAQAWSDRQIGLHCTLTCYNVFALPVLTYIAQLLAPPQQTLQAESTALQKIAPGPYNWISNSDLVWLRHLTGHPRSVASLAITGQAAQTRVRVWDPACADHEPDPGTPLEQCGVAITTTTSTEMATHSDLSLPNNLSTTSTFAQRAKYLRHLITAPDELYTRAHWRDWFKHSMLLTLDSNLNDVQLQIGSVRTLMARHITTNTTEQWRRIRRKFQSWVYAALHQQNAPDVHTRFTHKLDRWNLHSTTHPLHDHLSPIQRTPNWQARCSHQRLKTLAKLTTPRVHAAAYGAIWNRWCTLRRFQQRGHCRLCQLPHTEDSIEHYPFCTIIKRIATARLHLHHATQVNIHTFTLTNPFLRTQEQLIRAALLIYATYRALNHQRRSETPLNSEELHHAMSQWVVEGARGHTRTCRALASAWTGEAGNPLPRIQ